MRPRWWTLLLVLPALLGCGDARPAAPPPVPALAESREAQVAFRRIVARWLEAGPADRDALESPLRDFIARYPDDDLARPARLYLAWVLIQQRKLSEARALVVQARRGPAGSVQDFATVTEAAILIRVGKPDGALDLLTPLQGKIIDPAERLIFGEQLVQAALGGRKWRRAIGYMLSWLAEASPEDREGVQMAVQRQLPRIPVRALERTLVSLDQAASDPGAASQRAPARDWLSKTLRTYLAQLAIEQRDVDLATRLLDGGPTSLRRGRLGAALLRLAATGKVEPRVAGRAVGLVLSLGSPVAQRHSAEVARGVSRALGLPASASRPGAVRLLTRDDGETSGGVSHALAELAGDGAAILVAGVDEAGARAASRFAEMAAIPVLVLAQLSGPDPQGYTFVLGVDFEATEEVLAEALGASGANALVRVGPGGVACDLPRTAAGRPRFPVYEWKRDKVDALLLAGDAACARDALREAGSAGLRPLLGLGLRSGELFAALPDRQRRVAVAVGHFPVSADGAPSSSLAQWRDATGTLPTWYHALGHDAGLLVAAALAEFPLERTDDAQEVARLHRRARTELARATAALWSSDGEGFGEGRVLQRSPRVTEALPSR